MNPKLIIFDIDTTLTQKWTDDLLPGVAEYFQRNDLPHISLATNQGGVGLGYWMHKENFGNPDKYPTKNETMYRLIRLARSLDARLYVSFAYQSKKGHWSPIPENQPDIIIHTPGEHYSSWQSDWRKPSPGMLLQAIADANVIPSETLMVGDSDDDRLAAEAASCSFIYANAFFKRNEQ
jgi:histidinol phosphatase-like enzyme